jgi:hypothetical protein
VKLGEADADGGEKLVAGVLDIVLVIGIVDDSLQVAFIAAASPDKNRKYRFFPPAFPTTPCFSLKTFKACRVSNLFF